MKTKYSNIAWAIGVIIFLIFSILFSSCKKVEVLEKPVTFKNECTHTVDITFDQTGSVLVLDSCATVTLPQSSMGISLLNMVYSVSDVVNGKVILRNPANQWNNVLEMNIIKDN